MQVEIPCCVANVMPETIKNKEIIQKYKDMVDIMYTEPDGSAVVGSFVYHSINISLDHQKNKSNQTPKESSQFQVRLNPRGMLLQKNLKLLK